MIKPTRTVERKVSLLTDYTFLLQGWKGNLGVGWNTPAWTLSCEVFFYLCFPFLLPVIGRAGKWTLVATLAFTTIIPPALPHWGVPWEWKPVYHLSDFAAGIAASRIYDLSKRRWDGRGAWLYLPATVLGLGLIVRPQILQGTYGDLNAGLRPLNVAALLGLAYGGGVVAQWLSTRKMDLLGKASYSLYILHVPILWWYSKWAMRREMPMPRLVATALYVALVILASIVVFQRIEVPCNRFIRRRFGTARDVIKAHPYVTAP